MVGRNNGQCVDERSNSCLDPVLRRRRYLRRPLCLGSKGPWNCWNRPHCHHPLKWNVHRAGSCCYRLDRQQIRPPRLHNALSCRLSYLRWALPFQGECQLATLYQHRRCLGRYSSDICRFIGSCNVHILKDSSPTQSLSMLSYHPSIQ